MAASVRKRKWIDRDPGSQQGHIYVAKRFEQSGGGGVSTRSRWSVERAVYHCIGRFVAEHCGIR